MTTRNVIISREEDLMPLIAVRNKDGKVTGWKFGKRGKVYKGKDAKKKAKRQMAAMYANGYKGSAKG